jgi:hypothetical protein
LKGIEVCLIIKSDNSFIFVLLNTNSKIWVQIVNIKP